MRSGPRLGERTSGGGDEEDLTPEFISIGKSDFKQLPLPGKGMLRCRIYCIREWICVGLEG
jgi:hypothetical protein